MAGDTQLIAENHRRPVESSFRRCQADMDREVPIASGQGQEHDELTRRGVEAVRRNHERRAVAALLVSTNGVEVRQPHVTATR